jgi:ATP-dependent protease ClpP protease subunit
MSEDIDVYHKFKKDDIDQFMDNDIYLPTRTVYMGSMFYTEDGETGTDHSMAEQIIKCLHVLDNIDEPSRKGDKPITIIMNNIGGDEYHGMAIFDAIKNCKSHITIRVHGHAMSMGSIILQAADRRVMTKNSKIMIHYGTFGIYDHSKISYKWTDEGKKFDRMMEDLFLSKIDGRKLTLEKYLTLIGKQEDIPSGNAKNKQVEIDRERLQKMLDYDTFIDAETALSLNLIDKIEGADDY